MIPGTMDILPDAEPVMPERIFTVKNSDTISEPPILTLGRKPAADLNPGRAAMPTSDAVFMMASKDQMAPALSDFWMSWFSGICFKRMITSSITPLISAMIRDQMRRCF